MTARSFAALGDPGGVRLVVARWTITGGLILETAGHLGGGAGDVADMVLIRDARTGGPVLLGTSIAGALRSHLADVLGGYRSPEDERVARLFGAARGDDLGAQSPLVVFDSLGTLPDGHAVEIRDGVQIQAARGTAEEHKKFDLEVLPAGTSFPIRFDLVVSNAEAEPELLGLLVAALAGLSSGDIALGARRSRGLGAVRAAKWRATRHDLSSREGWLAWLLADGGAPSAGSSDEGDDVREACVRAHGGRALAELEDRQRRLVIDAEITSTGGLLVRSAAAAAGAPDAAHLRSAGSSVLPGTSVAGVLRNQTLRIARIVRDDKGDAEQWVKRLFGPRMQGVEDTEQRELRASKLRIGESIVVGGTRSRPSRVRIDRFTQGVVPGALFDEEPEHGGRVRLRFELREPARGELGLVLLVLKDLLTGELAIGGTSSSDGAGSREPPRCVSRMAGAWSSIRPGRRIPSWSRPSTDSGPRPSSEVPDEADREVRDRTFPLSRGRHQPSHHKRNLQACDRHRFRPAAGSGCWQVVTRNDLRPVLVPTAWQALGKPPRAVASHEE